MNQGVREGLVKWGIKMNLKKVLLELSVPDVQEILAIDLDGDADKALAFIREKVAKKVKKALQSH